MAAPVSLIGCADAVTEQPVTMSLPAGHRTQLITAINERGDPALRRDLTQS